MRNALWALILILSEKKKGRHLKKVTRMKFHDAIDLVDGAVKPDKLKNLCDIGVRLHALDANCHFREDRFADFVCLHTHRVDDGDEHRGGDVLIGRQSRQQGTSVSETARFARSA